MARIKDHKMTRVSEDGYKASWGYSGAVEGTVGWQYHANAASVSSPAVQKVMESAPGSQQHSPVSTTSVGSDDEPNVVTHPGLYWPIAPWRLIAVNMDMRLDGDEGTQSTQWLRFQPPKAPVIKATRNYSTVSFEIDSQAPSMEKSAMYRTSTRHKLQVDYMGEPPSMRAYSGISAWDGSFADEKKDGISFNAGGMPPSRPVKVRLAAANEGPSGESEVAYSETFTFNRPNAPTVTANPSPGKVTASIRANSDSWHPTEHVVLQRLVAPVFSENGSWQDVSDADYDAAHVAAIDDGQSSRIPPEDSATWYRAASWHMERSNVAYGYDRTAALMAKPAAPTVEGAFNAGSNTITANVAANSQMNVITRCRVVSGSQEVRGWFDLESGERTLPGTFDPAYSYQIEAKNVCAESCKDGLEHASDVSVSADIASSAQAEAIGARLSAVVIDSITPNPDGEGLTISFHWGEEDLSGTQATDAGTLVEWTSSGGGWISTVEPDSHKVPDRSGRSGVLSIDGLTEGVDYAIRVRRYATINGEDGYGPEATASAAPWSTPGKPVLTAPHAVAAGGAVRYAWTFSDANSTPQTEAHLYVGGQLQEPVLGPTGTFVYQTDGSTPASLEARVQVSAGGGWSELSDPVTTLVVPAPTCTAELAGSSEASTDHGGNTLTAMPLKLSLGGTSDLFRVTVRAASTASSPEPSGGRRVAAGQEAAVVDVYGGGVREVPCDLIIGGGAYDVEVVGTDTSTGLQSEPVTLGFGVTWAEPAAVPSATVSVEGGSATVTPSQGAGGQPGEECRVWRMTADGAMLCLEGGEWGAPYVDKWPPYGWDGCAYVVEAVSPDGDHAWAEAPYSMRGPSTCVDFGERLELPFNMQRKSSWSNRFERRSHLDGSRAGFFGPGYDRDCSISGDVPRDDAATTSAVSRLGQHDGICLVRGVRGVCFCAHVDASTDESYMEGRVAVDLSCRQVDDDGTFRMTRGE